MRLDTSAASTGIPAIAPITVSVIAADAIPATIRAHLSLRSRPIAAITPTTADPAEYVDEVTRTTQILPTADGSVRNPTMNQPHQSISADPIKSATHTHGGVVAWAGVVRSWVACIRRSLVEGHFGTRARNCSSSRTATLSFCAFSSFEPAPGPATT